MKTINLIIFPLLILISCSPYNIIKDKNEHINIKKVIIGDVVFSKYPQLTNDYKERLKKELLKQGFEIVDRDNLNQILKEQSLSLSGISDSANLTVGKIGIADAIINANLGFDYSNIELISIATSKIILKIESSLSIRSVVKKLKEIVNEGVKSK